MAVFYTGKGGACQAGGEKLFAIGGEGQEAKAGVISMTSSAIFVEVAQDAAVFVGIVLMIAGVVLEALEKAQNKKVLPPAATA